MKIAFYKVCNSKGYERHAFDLYLDRPDVVMNMLQELQDGEYHCYDMDDKYDVISFEDDYNDEVLDGGWWCVVIR